jgi:hypothetical protein
MSGEGQETDPWHAFAIERKEVIGAVGIAVLAVMLALLFCLAALLVL